jgi:hypothetical protein
VTRRADVWGGALIAAVGLVYFGVVERNAIGTALFVVCGLGLLALGLRRGSA